MRTYIPQCPRDDLPISVPTAKILLRTKNPIQDYKFRRWNRPPKPPDANSPHETAPRCGECGDNRVRKSRTALRLTGMNPVKRRNDYMHRKGRNRDGLGLSVLFGTISIPVPLRPRSARSRSRLHLHLWWEIWGTSGWILSWLCSGIFLAVLTG